MRVNVYNEEFTDEVEVGIKVAANHRETFRFVRLFLLSHDDLNHTETDDDRSAITFFADTKDELLGYFLNIIDKLK